MDDWDVCPYCGYASPIDVGWGPSHTCAGTQAADRVMEDRRRMLEEERRTAAKQRRRERQFLIDHGVDPEIAFFIT